MTLGFFAPVVFGGYSLIGSDAVQSTAMRQSMEAYAEETGETPLWEVNLFAGMPGYLIWYPDRVPQLDLVMRALNRISWPTFYFLLLLLGAYALVYTITRRSLAGLLTACAIGLTTHIPIILGAGHTSKFVAFAYAPWVLLAFVYLLRKPRLLGGLLFAIALALELRAGHPQIAYNLAFLVGIWWLVEGVAAWREGALRAFGMSTAWLALGTTLAVLMVAQPYLVFQEYKAYTIRGAATGGGAVGEAGGGLAWDYAMNWSHSPMEFLSLLIADAVGGGAGTYWGPKVFTEGPHYLGGIVLALAAFALVRVRKPVVWGVGLAALVTALFAMGKHAAFVNRPMFEFFPFFDAFRAPEIWMFTVELCLAMLAGIGLNALLRSGPDDREQARDTQAAYAVFGAALGLTVVLFAAHSGLFDFERPNEVEQTARQVLAQGMTQNPQEAMQIAASYVDQQRGERMELFRGSAGRTLVFLFLGGVLVALIRMRRIPGWIGAFGLVVLVAVDLWGISADELGEEKLTRGAATAQIPTYEFDRYLMEQVDAAGGPGRFRVLSLENNPTQWARPAAHYENVGGYHGAKLRLYQDFLEHVLFDPQTGLPSDNALDLVGGRFLVAGGQLPGTRMVFEDATTGLVVLERPDAAPRARLVGEAEVIGDAQSAWARLRDPAFDPARAAVVPAPLDRPITPVDSASTAEVRVVAYTNHTATWEVTTDEPRLLVTGEVYYPAGWSATIDGEESPILRVNHAFRGVIVPAGTHTVTMQFAPAVHTTSRRISLFATVLVYGATLALLAMAWVRRREPDASSA